VRPGLAGAQTGFPPAPVWIGPETICSAAATLARAAATPAALDRAAATACHIADEDFLLSTNCLYPSDVVLCLDVIGDRLLQLGPRSLELLARHRPRRVRSPLPPGTEQLACPWFTEVIGTFTCMGSAVA